MKIIRSDQFLADLNLCAPPYVWSKGKKFFSFWFFWPPKKSLLQIIQKSPQKYKENIAISVSFHVFVPSHNGDSIRPSSNYIRRPTNNMMWNVQFHPLSSIMFLIFFFSFIFNILFRYGYLLISKLKIWILEIQRRKSWVD